MNKLASNFLYMVICMIVYILTDAPVQATTMRIASYNVWNPIFEEKYSGHNTWDQRLSFLIENIISSQSDIICLEEVGKKAYLDLIQNSDVNMHYTSIYLSHARSQPGQQEGRDGLAFFYKPAKVTLMKFVQSPDGSRQTHRRDFYADLTLNVQRETPIRFRIACTHLDAGDDIEIGNTQLASLVEDTLKIDDTALDFAVVCGDFNEGEDEGSRPRHEIMQTDGFFTDGSTASTRPEALDVRHKGHVDWIYFKKLSSLQLDLIPLAPLGDEKGSDHKLTMTDVEIK